MSSEELNDLLKYFILSSYRDGEYFLLEEYEELQEILKRSSVARELEEARYKSIVGHIDMEEYANLCNKYINLINDKKKEKTR